MKDPIKEAVEALEPFADLAQESDRLRHGEGSSCMWLIPRCDLVKARDALTSLRALAAEAEVERLRGLPRVWAADDVRAALLEADRDPVEGESFADQLAKALNNLPTPPMKEGE